MILTFSVSDTRFDMIATVVVTALRGTQRGISPFTIARYQPRNSFSTAYKRGGNPAGKAVLTVQLSLVSNAIGAVAALFSTGAMAIRKVLPQSRGRLVGIVLRAKFQCSILQTHMGVNSFYTLMHKTSLSFRQRQKTSPGT